jgi:anti-sigma B factor antagonist
LDLSLESRTKGPWVVLEVAGELDLHTVPELAQRLATLMEQGASRLAVDLSRVGFMDSSSLGVLVTTLKRAREIGGDVVLVGVNGSPLKVLTLTGIDKVLKSYPSTSALPAE